MSDAEELRAAYLTQLDPMNPTAALIWSDLAQKFHAGATTFVPGDPQTSAFREGQRAVFLYLAGRVALPLTPAR